MLKSTLLLSALIFSGCASAQNQDLEEAPILVTNKVSKTKVEFRPSAKVGKNSRVDELRRLDQLLRVACASDDPDLCKLSATYADSRLSMLLDELQTISDAEATADLRKPASPR